MEEQRNGGASLLLLKESRTLPEVTAGIVSVLRPVTLSLDVHWDDDSELSVAVTRQDGVKGQCSYLYNRVKNVQTEIHFYAR